MGEREPRRWRMFAGREHAVQGREFQHFGEPFYVRLYGREPVEVELVEDPDGGYWGWIDLPTEFEPEVSGVPEMIQPHHGMFTMQFTYGPDIEVKHGKGEIVRMTCREITPQP